jgi:hypothetical protein
MVIAPPSSVLGRKLQLLSIHTNDPISAFIACREQFRTAKTENIKPAVTNTSHKAAKAAGGRRTLPPWRDWRGGGWRLSENLKTAKHRNFSNPKVKDIHALAN